MQDWLQRILPWILKKLNSWRFGFVQWKYIHCTNRDHPLYTAIQTLHCTPLSEDKTGRLNGSCGMTSLIFFERNSFSRREQRPGCNWRIIFSIWIHIFSMRYVLVIFDSFIHSKLTSVALVNRIFFRFGCLLLVLSFPYKIWHLLSPLCNQIMFSLVFLVSIQSK